MMSFSLFLYSLSVDFFARYNVSSVEGSSIILKRLLCNYVIMTSILQEYRIFRKSIYGRQYVQKDIY